MHAANLMHAMKAFRPDLIFRGLGGERMKEEGATLFLHLDRLSFMGFVEVIKHLPQILRNIQRTKKDILEFKPDALVLVDFPGFNFRIAKWAKQHNIPVIYYIAPQLWAWKEGRIKKVRAYVDRLHVILPFEPAFYAKHAIQAHFHGHPLLDEIERRKAAGLMQTNKPKQDLANPRIALLPGSREQEIKRCLPLMVEAVRKIPNARCTIAAVPAFSPFFYRQFLNGYDADICFGKTYETIQDADVAMVTSGTATLETALLKTPLLVMYRSNAISVWLARKLIKVKYISLVNLILDRLVVKEYIQDAALPDSLADEVLALLSKNEYREAQFSAFDELAHLLGDAGCSKANADSILHFVFQSKSSG